MDAVNRQNGPMHGHSQNYIPPTGGIIKGRRRMTVETFHDQSPRKNGTAPGLILQPLDLQMDSLRIELWGPVRDDLLYIIQ